MHNSISQIMCFKEMPNLTVSRSRYEREKTAREAAEKLLETKSYELYTANKKLKDLAMHLETIAEERAKELVQALKKRNWHWRLASSPKLDFQQVKINFARLLKTQTTLFLLSTLMEYLTTYRRN